MRRQWLLSAIICWLIAGLVGCASFGEPKVALGTYLLVLDVVITEVPPDGIAWVEWQCFPGPPQWCRAKLTLDQHLTGIEHEMRHILTNSMMEE